MDTPFDPAINPAGSTLYVASGSNFLTVIDTATNAVTGSVSLPGSGLSVAVTGPRSGRRRPAALVRTGRHRLGAAATDPGLMAFRVGSFDLGRPGPCPWPGSESECSAVPMMPGMKSAIAVIAAAAWISVSEFLRNNVLLLHYWVDHYHQLGLTFPTEPANGALWGLWSVLFAIAIYIISKRFGLIETALLSWFVAFVLMWVVIGNMLVLPIGILIYAVPLSLLETFIATLIIKSIGKEAQSNESLQAVPRDRRS